MMKITSVSYHHPLEEGLGPGERRLKRRLGCVSYHHPLEEGLGLGLPSIRVMFTLPVSYHHPLEEGLGLFGLSTPE